MAIDETHKQLTTNVMRAEWRIKTTIKFGKNKQIKLKIIKPKQITEKTTVSQLLYAFDKFMLINICCGEFERGARCTRAAPPPNSGRPTAI